MTESDFWDRWMKDGEEVEGSGSKADLHHFAVRRRRGRMSRGIPSHPMRSDAASVLAQVRFSVCVCLCPVSLYFCAQGSFALGREVWGAGLLAWLLAWGWPAARVACMHREKKVPASWLVGWATEVGKCTS